MNKVSCIIVEDEVPAQDVLKSYISRVDWLDLSGTFCDAFEALDFLKKSDVDMIFLDIMMPKITGLELLRTSKTLPQIIITTAYSNYAIEAFELDVRDYLMKPFSFDRFLKAVMRVTPKPEPLLIHQFQNVSVGKSFAFFNVNKTMVRVHFQDIQYLESMREYVYIHTPSGKVITKMKLIDAEKILGQGFLRTHRSFIVNLDKISAFNAEEVWVDQLSIPIGVNYKKMVESTLANYIKHN